MHTTHDVDSRIVLLRGSQQPVEFRGHVPAQQVVQARLQGTWRRCAGDSIGRMHVSDVGVHGSDNRTDNRSLKTVACATDIPLRAVATSLTRPPFSARAVAMAFPAPPGAGFLKNRSSSVLDPPMPLSIP